MKRRLTKLVVFLLLGAIANVGVAWGFSIWPIDRPGWLGQRDANFQHYEKFGSDGHLYLLTMVDSPFGEIQLSQQALGISLSRFSMSPAPIDEANFTERAIANVGVAWGFSIWPIDRPGWLGQRDANFQHYEKFGSDGHLYLLTMVDSPFGEIQLSQQALGISLSRFSMSPAPIDEANFRSFVPTWSRLATDDPFEEFVKHSNADYKLVEYVEYASGWPAYSLRYFGPVYVISTGLRGVIDESQLTGYFHPTLPRKMIDDGYRSELPFLPIWSGFAINTIFYAANLWLLALAPFAARGLIRQKRGHCIKCGYDLRGSSGGGSCCPECGFAMGAD